MRQFFSFWWRCTKIAAKGNSSFANDWQWVYGNPIVSGLGAVVIGTIGGAAPSLAHLWGGSEMTTGHPATDAFIGALCAYLVTWLVIFFVRLLNAPVVLLNGVQAMPENSGMTMREYQLRHEENLALREHTEELRRQRESQAMAKLVDRVMAPPRPLNVEIGKHGAFILRKGYGLSTIKHTYNLKVTNRDQTKPITNCRVAIVDVTPDPLNKKLPWLLHEPFSLASGDSIFIPLATFGEARNPQQDKPSDTLIQVHSAQADNWFLIELQEHTIGIRVTSHDSGYFDLTCKLWVDNEGRFQIKKV
jgi:hypothetical protein